MRRKPSRWLILGGAVLVLSFVWVWAPWEEHRYQGDGTFTDSDFFTGRPGCRRDAVRFAGIPLNKIGESRYHFRGLSNEYMNLYLSVDRKVTPQSNLWHELPSLQTTIETVLSDGHEVCKAVGKPGGAYDMNSVSMLTKGFGNAHWCDDIRFRASESYELTVSVKTTDPRSGDTDIAPILGNYLECEVP
jgi:hypothetical protein